MNTHNFSTLRSLWLFVAAAFGAGLLTLPTTAAAWRRQNANAVCRIVTNTSVPAEFQALAPHEIRNPQSLNYLRLLCPIPDSTDRPKANWTGVSLSVTDSSTSLGVDVTTCISFSGSAGGTCGATSATGTSFTGATTLAATLGSSSAWTASTATDFGYLVVNVPPKDFSTGATSTFRGIYSTP